MVLPRPDDATSPPRPPTAPAAGRLDRVCRVHLVGVGGTGMSGLAHLLLDLGKEVSGSDARAGTATAALARRGARIDVGHAAAQVGAADLVVISAAVAADNPEVVAARERGIAVLSHAEVLGLLVAAGRGLAIAGTHGKTTTTALVGFLLERTGRDPTILAGSEMLNYGASVRLGHGGLVVVEADEYDRRFLHLRPAVAVVSSVEVDHLDYYRDLAEIQAAFAAFAGALPPDGLLLAYHEDALAAALPTPARRLTYGLDPGADWRAEAVRPLPDGMAFVARGPAGERADVRLPLLGRHNVANALAALATVAHEGVPLADAAAALAEFRGTRRRFQRVGSVAGVTVVDDYAHHPTAVRVTLEAARAAWEAGGSAGPLWVVFQPHTRNRTARLLDEFAAAFAAADAVVVTAIYEPVGREREPLAISGADLARRINGPTARYVPDLEAAADYLAATVPPDALVLTMGAGDVDRVGPLLLERLRARGSDEHQGAAVPSQPPAAGSATRASSTVGQGPPDSALSTQYSALRELRERLLARVGDEARVRLGERLDLHTSYRLGGPADLFLAAETTEEVIVALQAAHALGVPCRVIGGASNLLVADEGVDGLVVKNLVKRTSYRADPADPDRVTLVAAAGCQLMTVARQSARRGLTGLVWATNVPGTVGAAVVNNAGAFGSAMAEVLERALLVDASGQTCYLAPADLAMAYRTTRLKRRELELTVLEAELALRRGDATALQQEVLQVRERRKRTQPDGRSAGSMFTNPPGDAAGRLIEVAGLKGARVGGAVVSPLHANFILNEGGATARDVYALMRRVQAAVHAHSGVWLVPEVQLLGRWAPDDLAALASPATNGAAAGPAAATEV